MFFWGNSNYNEDGILLYHVRLVELYFDQIDNLEDETAAKIKLVFEQIAEIHTRAATIFVWKKSQSDDELGIACEELKFKIANHMYSNTLSRHIH
jgi:hypothetical protein